MAVCRDTIVVVVGIMYCIDVQPYVFGLVVRAVALKHIYQHTNPPDMIAATSMSYTMSTYDEKN